MYNINEVYIVVDIETTGPSYKNGPEIIEIGAVKIVDGKILEKRGSLIPFQSHGITKEMTKNQPSLEEVLPKVRKYIGNSIVVCHNTRFDIPFLNRYLKKMDCIMGRTINWSLFSLLYSIEKLS